MTINYETIAERGSLVLTHDAGSETEPEQYWVSLIERPNVSGSLQVAADWRELNCGDYRLNGSQCQTVDAWVQEYL